MPARKRPHNWESDCGWQIQAGRQEIHRQKKHEQKKKVARDVESSDTESVESSTNSELHVEEVVDEDHDETASVNLSDMEEEPPLKKPGKRCSEEKDEDENKRVAENEDEEDDEDEESGMKKRQLLPKLSKIQMLRKQHKMEMEASRRLHLTMLGRDARQKGTPVPAEPAKPSAAVKQQGSQGSDWEDDSGDDNVSEHALFGTSDEEGEREASPSLRAGPTRERASSVSPSLQMEEED